MKSILYILIITFLTACDHTTSTVDKMYYGCYYFIQEGRNKENTFEERCLYNGKALEILTNNPNGPHSKSLLFKVADNYGDINEWEKFKVVIDIIKDNTKNNSSLYDKAKLYEFFGEYYTNKSINDSAFYCYTKAEKIYINKKNDTLLCNVIRKKAFIQYYAGDLLGSETNLINALRIAKKMSLIANELKIYNLLGVISNDLGQFDQSLIYHRKALKISKKYKIQDLGNQEATTLNCIGYNFYCLNKFNEAIEYYNEALKKTNSKDDPYIYAKLLDNIALVRFQQKHYYKLEDLYFKAEKIRDSFHIEQAQNFNKLYLSEYYAKIKDTLKAKKYANEAYALSQSFKAPNDMMICLKQLSKIDPINAIQHSAQYIKISDSMHQLERETRNKFAKIAYETEEITQEKELAEKQKSIFLGTTITVAVFGMLLLIIASQRIKQKELLFAQSQQEAKEEIYQLIHTQQNKIDEGRQKEKQRIARDLHDGIMNRLASTRFNLHVLNNKTDRETIKNCIPYIDGIHDIEKEIRNIAHDLNKEVFSENDSFKRILLTFFEEQKNILHAKLHADIDKNINWQWLESSQKINLYRILQEAFQNASKHSHAENIFVSFTNQEHYILLEIHDDGVGFSDSDKKQGIGLQNIRARAKDCKGIFHINSSDGNGSTMIVSIPTKKNLT